MSSKSAEMQAIEVLRALLIIQKHPMSVHGLLREYREMEGTTLPFRNFGYSSAEEFLKSCGEFVVVNDRGETLVGARPSVDSAHIANMVAKQKLPKRRSKRASNYFHNRMPSNCGQQNRNKTSYLSNVYREIGNRNQKHNYSKSYNLRQSPFRNVDTRLNINNEFFGTELSKNFKQSIFGPKQTIFSQGRGVNHKENTNDISKSEFNEKFPSFSSFLESKSVNNFKFESKKTEPLSFTNFLLENKNVAKMSFDNKEKDNLRISNCKSNASSVGRVFPVCKENFPEKQSKEKKAMGPFSRDLPKENLEISSKREDNKIEKICLPTEKYEFDLGLNAIKSLKNYCLARGYPEPLYDSKNYKGLLYSVLVNGKKYTTYPKYFNDREIAMAACASIAIEEIKSEESKCIFYPICADSDSDLLLKIYEELKKNHTGGIFKKMFKKMFESRFKQTLPDHWFSLIENSNYVILENTIGTENTIIVPNLYLREIDHCLTEDDEFKIESIELPWDSKYWNIYVTNCASTIEIWARIVDKEYNQQLDSLLNDIESSMSVDRTVPDSLKIGQIYLVYISDCWHRVRLESIDKEISKCLCFFIDFGDADWLLVNQLFICEKKFLKLPPQAVLFTLFGLEDFAENPVSNRILNEVIMGTTLIAKICTSKESYESSNEMNKIQVVLYDTSSNIDVIVNDVLIEKICTATPPPELKKNSVINVKITHVSDDGDVYLQILNKNLRYVQKLIQQLMEYKFLHDQYTVDLANIKISTLYLIYDKDDLKWYRGCLADFNVKNRNTKEFKIFYVDEGLTKLINISNIFCLESLSTALYRFPRQAIKAKMYNLTPSNFVLNKMKALLPDNSLAIVKLAFNELSVVHDAMPQIIVFIRTERHQSLCNVNDAIRIEYELISNDFQDEIYNGAKSESNCSSSTSMSPTSFIHSSVMIPSALIKGSLPIELNANISLPEKGAVFDVLVTIASNPFDFYVRSYNDLEFQNMMTELQNHCQNNNECISDDMIEPGEAYAALLEDGLYYRCIIERTLPNQKCSVYFCDRGNRNTINVKELSTLPGKCRELPTQAIKAKIHGILPINGTWSREDQTRFKELTNGKNFVSFVKNISFDISDFNRKSKVLELKLLGQSNSLVIHEVLLEENRAILS